MADCRHALTLKSKGKKDNVSKIQNHIKWKLCVCCPWQARRRVGLHVATTANLILVQVTRAIGAACVVVRCWSSTRSFLMRGQVRGWEDRRWRRFVPTLTGCHDTVTTLPTGSTATSTCQLHTSLVYTDPLHVTSPHLPSGATPRELDPPLTSMPTVGFRKKTEETFG